MNKEKLGLVYGLGAYVLWGLFPLYWPLLKPATSPEIVSHRAVWTMVFCFIILAITKSLKSTLATFTRYPVAAVIATFGIVLAALYILIPVQRALHGPTTPGNENLPDLTLREKVAIAPVIAIIVALGFYPSPVLNIINPAATTVISQQGFTDPAPTNSEGK